MQQKNNTWEKVERLDTFSIPVPKGYELWRKLGNDLYTLIAEGDGGKQDDLLDPTSYSDGTEYSSLFTKEKLIEVLNSNYRIAKQCADFIKKEFYKLNTKHPNSTSFDLIKDQHTNDILLDLIKNKSGEDIETIFQLIDTFLVSEGLRVENKILITTANDINKEEFNVKLEGSFLVDGEELLYREKAEKCADKLIEVFLRLKQENPLNTEIDVYKDKEGWKAITDLVDGAGSDASILFDDKLKTALIKYGLTFSRPSYDYFVEKSTSGSVWFNLYFSGEDTIKNQEIARRIDIFFVTIQKIFKDNKDTDRVSIKDNPTLDQGLKLLLQDITDNDVGNQVLHKLKQKLEEIGLDYGSGLVRNLLLLKKADPDLPHRSLYENRSHQASFWIEKRQ